MRFSTLIAIILGIAAIFGAFIWEGGTPGALIIAPAMVIVFGGTLAAGLAGSSWEQMKKLPKLFALSFNPPKYNMEAIVNQIVQFSIIARKEGILALENKLDKVEHPFMKKLFQVCIDGADPETLQQIVDTEVSHISHRHEENISLFTKMGGYSPTMGIIGTVMALISTLAAAGEDPNVLIHHIATAFIATMWGIFMANIVWLPVGDKLKKMHDEEMQILQVMLDGVYSVQLGESPSVIRSKLATAFPLHKQEEILSKPISYPKKKNEKSTQPEVKKETDEKKEEKQPEVKIEEITQGK